MGTYRWFEHDILRHFMQILTSLSICDIFDNFWPFWRSIHFMSGNNFLAIVMFPVLTIAIEKIKIKMMCFVENNYVYWERGRHESFICFHNFPTTCHHWDCLFCSTFSKCLCLCTTKKGTLFIFPHPLTVHLFVVVEKMPHLILSCEVQGSFRLKCSSYKEELGTPVFLTVNKIKTQGERDVIQQNILSASIAWQSISHLVKVWCFYSFCPGRPAARLQKNSCTHSPTFCSSCFILLKLFFVVERRHVANHDTTPHCI